MKTLRRIAGCWMAAGAILCIASVMIGCRSERPAYVDFPGLASWQATLQIGETVTVISPGMGLPGGTT